MRSLCKHYLVPVSELKIWMLHAGDCRSKQQQICVSTMTFKSKNQRVNDGPGSKLSQLDDIL
jgi:hypothetical protein